MAASKRPLTSSLTDDELRLIHDAGLLVLGSSGVIFESEEVLRRFRAAGFATDGQRVFMTEDQVTAAIGACPRELVVEAREPARSLFFGRGSPVVANASGATHVVDGGTTRPAAMADVATCVQLCHQLEHIDMVGYALYLRDMGDPAVYRRTVWEHVTLTDKPIEYPVFTQTQVAVFEDVQEILFGARWHERPRFLCIFCSSPPLRYDADTCATVVALTRRRQPLCVTSCALGGVSGPATAGGLLVVQHAEILAGIVLAQLLSPGGPVIYGGLSSSASMRTGGMLTGDPVFWGIAAATVELGHWLRLPVRAGAASTDADRADLQAGMESALGLAFAFERGVDFVLQGMGALSSLHALSFDKLVVDDDLVGALKTRPWQLDLGPESLACDVIAEVGPGGMYLGHRHTRKYGRGRASLFSRDVPGVRPDEQVGALAVAAARVAALLDSYRPPELDAVCRRQLALYCSI